MQRIPSFILTLLLGYTCTVFLSCSTVKTEVGFTPMFNQSNFSGWDVVVNDTGTDRALFSIKKGIIHVYPTQADGSSQSFGGLVSQKEYHSYTLNLEYKWGTGKFKPREAIVRDAGILFHMHGEANIWPNSVECQIQEGDTGDIWVIGTQVSSKVNTVIRNYDPNGKLETGGGKPDQRFYRFHRGYSWEKPGWNYIKLEVEGDDARYYVNGHLVNEAIDMKYWDASTQTWKPLTKGKILLQAEGAELFYRNVAIHEK